MKYHREIEISIKNIVIPMPDNLKSMYDQCAYIDRFIKIIPLQFHIERDLTDVKEPTVENLKAPVDMSSHNKVETYENQMKRVWEGHCSCSLQFEAQTKSGVINLYWDHYHRVGKGEKA